MREWREVALGDVTEVITKGTTPTTIGRAFVQSGIAFVKAESIDNNGRLIDAKLAAINAETHQLLARSQLRRDDILFSIAGVIGRTALVRQTDLPANTNQALAIVRVSSKCDVDPVFLYYQMRSDGFLQHGLGRVVQTAQANLSLGMLRSAPIALPSLLEQRTIAAVLGALDDLIENNRRRVEVLEAMARAIYREWFVYFRYPGHEDVPLVGSALGPIPIDWKAAELQSVAKVNRLSRAPTRDEVIRYLDISALGERTVGSPSELAGGDAPGRARRVVVAGDIVWSMVRPNRRAHALLVDPGPDWIASTGLAVLSATSVSSTWLFEATSTQEFTDHLVSKEGGAAYPAVKPSDFQRAPIVVPPPAIDGLFASLVAPMHRLSWSLCELSGSLAAIRDRLLPKLVTGQIDVSHLDLDALTEATIT